MAVPTVSATRGLPVAVTGRSNPTATLMVSPSSKVAPSAGELEMETLVTAGAVARLPSTLRFVSAVTAACVRSASTALSVSLMVPPASARALAAMLTPSVSRSAA